MKDLYVVSQGRVLVVPDWPAPPDVPDWLRLGADLVTIGLGDVSRVQHLRRLHFV